MPVSKTTLPKMRFQVVERDLWKLRVPLKIKIFHWFSKKGMTFTKAKFGQYIPRQHSPNVLFPRFMLFYK